MEAKGPRPARDRTTGGLALTFYSLLLAATVLANLWFAGLVALRSNRRFPRAVLMAFFVSFAVSHVITIGRLEGGLAPSWSATGLTAFIVAHALVAAFAILFLHGEPIRRRMPTLAAIFVPGLALAAVGGSRGWRPEDTFQPAADTGIVILNAYLVACLAIALAEALASRRRDAPLQREASFLAMGTITLIVGGPVYSFELVVLGITGLLGANPAAPIGGGLFALALFRANPLPFAGREPRPTVQIPWSIPPGTYLVEETRPKYAEAMMLATGAPGLAILSEPAAQVPGLKGADLATLPAGERSGAVLAATSSEFLARHPEGSLLVDDLSYVIVNGGLRVAAGAVGRIAHGMPKTARLIVSLSKLTEDERDAVARSVPGTRVTAPELAEELDATLSAHLGGSKDQLQRATLALGKRVEDLAVTDLPGLRDYWLGSLVDLRSPTDEAARSGWKRVCEALAADLESLWRTPPTETRHPIQPAAPVARPPMANPKGPSPDGFSLVRATEVLDASSRVASAKEEASRSFPLGTALREAFLGSLGPAGEPVYRRVIAALGKEPSAIRSDDLSRVVKLAEETLSDLGSAIDVEAAKRDLVERTQRLRVRLEGLLEETP